MSIVLFGKTPAQRAIALIRGQFAAGEQGVWYDPSDFSTLFQDSAGTTPVTAVTQPVGKILDKSGRGNHASQATAGARPTLRQDASGHYYLLFDGTDDYLSTGAFDVSPAGSHFSVASVQVAAIGAVQNIVDADNFAGTPRISQNLRLTVGGQAQTIAFAGGAAFTTTGGSILTTSAPAVISQLTAPTLATTYVNNVAGTPVSITGVPASGTVRLMLCATGQTAGSFFGGRLYGALHIGSAVGATTRTTIGKYLGSKVGLAL